MIPSARKRRFRCRGAAVVEFALVIPLFLLLLIGIVEFGRAMMVQQVLINASREGARKASLPGATLEDVKSTVADYLSDSSIPASLANIDVSPDPATTFDNEQITVRVEVAYQDVGWIFRSFFASLEEMDLRATTRMRSERFQ